MNLQLCERMAKGLISKYLSFGWSFEWCRTKSSLGTCRFYSPTDNTRGIIRLSSNWMSLISEEEARDTVLHEIAHALAGYYDNHGPIWQRYAIKIGAKPYSVAKTEVKVDPKYVAISPITGNIIKRWMITPSQRVINEFTKERYIIGRPETKGKIRVMSFEQFKKIQN